MYGPQQPVGGAGPQFHPPPGVRNSRALIGVVGPSTSQPFPPNTVTVCQHDTCPVNPTKGSRYCFFHLCPACGGDKSSNNTGCTACLAKGFTGLKCGRVNCSLPVNKHGKYCAHHYCSCGNADKSSHETVCDGCKGKIGTQRNPRRAGNGAPNSTLEAEDDAYFNLEEELAKIVGLNDLKLKLRSLQKQLQLDAKRKLINGKASGDRPLHMMFRGNPGTGKTSIGRLLARMLKNIGVIPKSTFVEVQRGDLVAQYIGQTAKKTRGKIEEARGGVLFVDEAYRLSSAGGKDFGTEAIEELMSVMNETDIIIVLAGYPADMDKFIEVNAGLFRRVRLTFDFTDYTCDELAQILRITAVNHGFAIGMDDATVSAILHSNTTPAQRAKLNGGLCEFIFDEAKAALDGELDVNDPNPSCKLSARHIKAGCQRVPVPRSGPPAGRAD